MIKTPVRSGFVDERFMYDRNGNCFAEFTSKTKAKEVVLMINRYNKLVALAESVERLNPACAEIGAGRLAQLVHDAKEALK